jgi:alpha-N-arabinofuranosidase
MMLRNPVAKWWRLSGGALQLAPRPEGLGDVSNPSLIARRQQHLNATATTRITFSPSSDTAEAGLVAFQNDDHWYFLAVGRDHGKRVVRLRRRDNSGTAGEVLATAPLPSAAPVELRIAARGAAYEFSWSGDGRRWHSLIRHADGTVVSTKKAGGFVGAVFGLYAHDAGLKAQ